MQTLEHSFAATLQPKDPVPFRRRSSRSLPEERRSRLVALAAGFRIFAKLGLNEVTAGHISVRDPELTDYFWLNPYGLAFSQIKVSDLMLVTPQRKIAVGEGPLNPGAFSIHSEIYAARPEAEAAAHSHSIHGRALAALHQTLLPITQDATVFYEENVLIPDFNGVALDVEEGKRIVSILGNNHTGILANHGILTVGDSIEDAVTLFVLAERAAQVQLIAAAAGELRLIPHEMAKLTHDQEQRTDVGWARFQPLFQEIVAEQPNFLE